MRLFALALALAAAAPACAQPAPLAEEPLLQVARLPDVWPKSFVVVHDVNFNSILDGRLAVVDTASPNQPLKGLVRDSQMGGALFSRQRGEILTAETFYSRLTRGERTDAVTIWDMKTLQPKGEIVLPGGKRQQSVIYPHLFQFTNHQKWALLANFTPAQSVSVIDIDARKVINEIDLPGCSQIYPTGERGFSSLCADGSIFSVVLDAQGKAASSATIRNVQEIDHQAYFSTPAYIGGTAWFVSQRGLVQGFDLSGPVAKVVPGAFSLGTAPGADPEWRPSGYQVINADTAGRLYVLMTPHGKEGSHKDGGTAVWVVDPVRKARVAIIPLKGPTMGIGLTEEDVPHLVGAQVDGTINVYDTQSGAFVRSLGATVAFNPFLVYTVR